MNCKRVDNLMVDYIYGEMIPAEREAFEAHLAECPECAAMVEGLGSVRRMATELPDPEPSRMVTNKIIAHAREEAENKRPGWGFGWLKMLAALCVIGVVGGLFIFQKQTGIYTEEKAVNPIDRTAENKAATPAPAPEPAPQPAVMPEPAAEPAPPTRSITPVEAEDPTEPRTRSIMAAKDEPRAEPSLPIEDNPQRVAGTTLVIVPDPVEASSDEKARRVEGTSLVIEPDPVAPASEAVDQPAPGINGSLSADTPPAAPKLRGGSGMEADTGAPKPGTAVGLEKRKKAAGKGMKKKAPTPAEGGEQLASLEKDEAAPKAEADRMPDLFEQGKQAMGAGRFEVATDKFKAALSRLTPEDKNRPRVLLWLARSYEYQGMTSMAVDTYTQLADESSEYYEFAHHKIRQLSE